MTLIQIVDTPPPCAVCGQRMTRKRDGWSCQDPDCDARGYMYWDDAIHLDWRDCLRVLLLGRLRATVLIYTDVEVKDAESRSVVWVARSMPIIRR